MLATLTVLWLAFLTQSAPSTTGSISGQVINVLTGKPIGRATVQLNRAGISNRISAVTDAEGHFEFPTVEPGEWIITALKAGFGMQVNLSLQPGPGHLRVPVAAGTRVTGVGLLLKPESVITGRVVNESGEPLADVLVQLMHWVYMDGRRRLEQVRLANDITNDRGEYRIYGIMPGRYCLTALGARDGVSFDRAGPVYYPAASDASGARQFDIRPGTELRGMDFVLLPARLVRLSGRVFDEATGKSPARATLRLSPAGSTDTGTTPRMYGLGSGGTFVLTDVRVGSYTFLVDTGGTPETRLSGQISVNVGDSNIENLEVPLTAPAELAGSVRVDGREGFGDLVPTRLTVTFRPRQIYLGSASGKVDANGAFVIRNASPGLCDISFTGLPDGFYLKSARFQKDEVIDTGLEVRGSGKLDLNLIVGADAAQIDGTVKDRGDKPAAGATVVLVPSDPALRNTPWRFKDTTAAHDGVFSLKGIPPGSYQLYAWDEIESGIWFDSDFLKPFEEEALSLSLASEDRKTITLRLPAPQEKREGREP